MKVKAISLWQPWASCVALGLKTIETRGWLTSYLGPIAIHAAQKKSRANRQAFEELLEDPEIYKAFQGVHYGELPFGAIVATAELEDCVRADMISGMSDLERSLGDYGPGRVGWILNAIKALAKPFPVSGRQGFFFVNVPDRLLP